jgi:large subunit ribosomal protein L4
MAETKVKTTKPAVKTTKAVAKKAEVKKTPVTAKVVESKNSEVKTGSLKITVVGVDGASMGNMTLPEAVFGAKPNKALIAQAVRVYLANQRQGNASTKTRGEVIGTTKKIYRQKGTGRARHGAAKAPIFVGGGIAHGPHPHDFSMDFPKKMKQKHSSLLYLRRLRQEL